jgi:hypothetical protein
MTWRNLSLDWQMTWLNLLAVSTMMLGLKAIALLVPGTPAARTWRFLSSPMLAPNSLERSLPLRAAPAFFLRAGLCLGALLLYYGIYWQLVPGLELRGLALS